MIDGKLQNKPALQQIVIYQVPFIVYASLIFVVSSFSKLPTPDLGLTFADKIIHLIEYGLFSLLALRGLLHPPVRLSPAIAYSLAIGISVIYAALDEYHQSFVPGRNADVFDVLADIFGAILALLVYYKVKRRRNMS